MTTQSGVTAESEKTQSEKTEPEATAPPGSTLPPGAPTAPKRTARKASAPTTRAGRRVGYAIAIVINLALLYLINVMPGWTAIGVLTVDFTSVLWIINLSLLLSVAANVAYTAYDSAWFKASCEFTLAAISLVIAIRMYQVFPFDFATFAFNWTVLARLIIVVVMIGSLVAMVINAVRLFIAIVSGPPPASAGQPGTPCR